MSTVLNIVEATKVCRGCKAEKSLGEFHKNAGYIDGHLSVCKDCRNSSVSADQKAKAREYHKSRRAKIVADPVLHAKLKEGKNAWNRSEKYYDMYYGKRFGVSYKALVAMLASQNGLCANIGCSRTIVLPPSEGDLRACVDHNHETGKVRSLLCTRCNTFLGHIENNRNLVPGIMDYLNKHN